MELLMANHMTSENLQKVFTFPFQDPKWLEKFLIGSLLFLVSFLILPLLPIYGYLVELMRMTIEGRELVLPEWDQWERKFTDGLKLFILSFLYGLPFAILFVVLFALLFAAPISSEFFELSEDPSSPIWVIPSLLGSFGGLALFGLGSIAALVAGVFVPVITAHVVATDDFTAAFRIGEWWQIFRANLSGFVIAYLLTFGVFTALSIVSQILYMTVILCCILPLISYPATFYIMVISSVLFGQAYREGTQILQS
jgi:hypothetical protein